MNRRRLVVCVVAVLLAINLGIGIRVHSALEHASGEDESYLQMRQFARVLKLIRQDYVDTQKTGYPALMRGAVQGMIGALDDPFSSFVPPAQHRQLAEQSRGEYGGIGMVMSKRDKHLKVVAPLRDDAPGVKAGLRPSDEIVKINGEDISALPINDAVSRIKGEPGTKVELEVYNPETRETRKVVIERQVIEIDTVQHAKLLAPGLGYVIITNFNEKTPESLQKALSDLVGQGMKGLVMDLRDNGGGLLDSARDVAGLFLEEGKLVVTTEGRRQADFEAHHARAGRKFLKLPLVLLTNGGTASGAEIVAGCLHDYDLAHLVGEKTYGKGSVQRIVPLEDGSALRLTVALYYTPNHQVIHRAGIQPDDVIAVTPEEAMKLLEQRSRLSGMAGPPGEKEVPDLQLARAVTVLAALVAGAPVPPLPPPAAKPPLPPGAVPVPAPIALP